MKRLKMFLALSSIFFVVNCFASLRLASYNIRNFDYDQRSHISTNKEHLKSQIADINADLLAIQEINKKDVFESFIRTHFSDYAVVLSNCGGQHNQHLGFVYKTDRLELVRFHDDSRTVNATGAQSSGCGHGSRPLAVAEFKLKGSTQKIIAVSVHLKSGGRPSSINKRFNQLSAISNVIREYRDRGEKNFVIMGDFNSTEYVYKKNEYKKFQQMIANMQMQDLTRNIKCTSYWWGGRDDGKQYPTLLDHILISDEFIGEVSERQMATPQGHCSALRCEVTNEHHMGVSFDEVSDHCPVSADVL